MRQDGGLLGDRTRLTLGTQPSIERDTWRTKRSPHAEIEPCAFDNAFTGTHETNWLFLALND